MKTEDIKKMAQAWNQVQEASYGKKKEAMDPVDAKELKGKHKDRKDKDIDNDGDVDKSDEYLHKRRKAVSKAIKGKQTETETEVQEAGGHSSWNVTFDHPDHKPVTVKARNTAEAIKKAEKKATAAAGKKHLASYKNITKESVEELDEAVHTVEIDHEGDQDHDAFKHKITLKHGGAGGTTATGKKKDLQKYLAKHYVSHSDAKDTHPEVFESVELDELSKKTLTNYLKKAEKKATKAGDSYSNAAFRRHDFAPDTPAMAKNAKILHKRIPGIDRAHAQLAKKESVELDELSKKTLGSYVKKASGDLQKSSGKAGYASGKGVDKSEYDKQTDRAEKRRAGISKATDKLTKEAKDHGNMNNGTPRGEGLSPSAKKELARTTPMPDAVNEPMVDKKTFDAIRASGKKAPMRSNDNAQGDKTMPKNNGK